MRLDHLLSREPSSVGDKRVLAGLVGAWLFSCACMCLLPIVGGGCGCVFWVGHKSFYGRQAHCRVHVQHRVSVRRPLVVVARAASLRVCSWVWVVCGGLFVICIVVASIFVLYCFLCFV